TRSPRFPYTTLFRSRHVLVWMVLPFVLFHVALPHKELRFLYPLADLMPLLLVMSLDIVMRHWPAFTARIQGKGWIIGPAIVIARSEEHTSELQSREK